MTALKKRLAAPEITLNEMPMDLRKYILSKQAEIKIKKGIGKYSLQSTIYKIIEEHQKMSANQAD